MPSAVPQFLNVPSRAASSASASLRLDADQGDSSASSSGFSRILGEARTQAKPKETPKSERKTTSTSNAKKSGTSHKARKAGKREDADKPDDAEAKADRAKTDHAADDPSAECESGALPPDKTDADPVVKKADDDHAATSAEDLARNAATAQTAQAPNAKPTDGAPNQADDVTRKSAKTVVRPIQASAKAQPEESPDAGDAVEENASAAASGIATTAKTARDAADEDPSQTDSKPPERVASIKIGGPLATASAGKASNSVAAASDVSSSAASQAAPNANLSAQSGIASAISSAGDPVAQESGADAKSLKLSTKPPAEHGDDPTNPAIGAAASSKSAQTESTTSFAAPPIEAAPESRFAETNHARIVTGVHGELLPNGGTMRLRLDPPELGELLVSVRMRDGVMTALFQTSNDQATQLLSHSLSDLKGMLESQGVTVERLHVEQAPRREQNGDGHPSDPRNPTPEDQQSARRDQQRREMIQRLWDKLANGKDPLDLVA